MFKLPASEENPLRREPNRPVVFKVFCTLRFPPIQKVLNTASNAASDGRGSSTVELKRVLSALFAGIVVSVNMFFPIGGQLGTAADCGDSFAENLIVQGSAFAVAVIINGVIFVDAEAGYLGSCVDIRTEKLELPAVLFLLSFDHLLYLFVGAAAAGVLHTVGDDDEQRLLGNIVLAGLLVNAADMVNRAADGIQQSGTTPCRI